MPIFTISPKVTELIQKFKVGVENDMRQVDRPVPLRRLRKASQKPPMPKHLEPLADKARARHQERHANPGVAIEVEKVTEYGYRVASPHSDTEAWQAMVCDALGTRSEATALTFIYQLTKLCEFNWHPDEAGSGETVPDERQLNMIINMIGSIKPKNEMQAALAAQMVAVHLMMMRATEASLRSAWGVDPRFAPIAGKLARTFAMQTEAMQKLKGQRSSRQTIKVINEKQIHNHQHVHVISTGGGENGHQLHAPVGGRFESHESCAAMSGEEPAGRLVRIACSEGDEGLPNARRQTVGSANR